MHMKVTERIKMAASSGHNLVLFLCPSLCSILLFSSVFYFTTYSCRSSALLSPSLLALSIYVCLFFFDPCHFIPPTAVILPPCMFSQPPSSPSSPHINTFTFCIPSSQRFFLIALFTYFLPTVAHLCITLDHLY